MKLSTSADYLFIWREAPTASFLKCYLPLGGNRVQTLSLNWGPARVGKWYQQGCWLWWFAFFATCKTKYYRKLCI